MPGNDAKPPPGSPAAVLPRLRAVRLTCRHLRQTKKKAKGKIIPLRPV